MYRQSRYCTYFTETEPDQVFMYRHSRYCTYFTETEPDQVFIYRHSRYCTYFTGTEPDQLFMYNNLDVLYIVYRNRTKFNSEVQFFLDMFAQYHVKCRISQILFARFRILDCNWEDFEDSGHTENLTLQAK